jgi:hypothetical protein
MIVNKSLFFSSLFLVVFHLTVPSHAQEFGFGRLDSNSIAALRGESTSSSTRAATGVNTLPADYLSDIETKTEAPVVAELDESHESANWMVLSGLAAMLGIGMGITGICILRRQPKQRPAVLVHSTHLSPAHARN